MSTTKVLSVRVKPSLHRAVRVAAAEQERTVADLVAAALESYLVAHPAPPAARREKASA